MSGVIRIAAHVVKDFRTIDVCQIKLREIVKRSVFSNRRASRGSGSAPEHEAQRTEVLASVYAASPAVYRCTEEKSSL